MNNNLFQNIGLCTFSGVMTFNDFSRSKSDIYIIWTMHKYIRNDRAETQLSVIAWRPISWQTTIWSESSQRSARNLISIALIFSTGPVKYRPESVRNYDLAPCRWQIIIWTNDDLVHWRICALLWIWFNIKIPSYPYRKSQHGYKTILQLSYLRSGISNTDKTTYLKWIRALVFGTFPWVGFS